MPVSVGNVVAGASFAWYDPVGIEQFVNASIGYADGESAWYDPVGIDRAVRKCVNWVC